MYFYLVPFLVLTSLVSFVEPRFFWGGFNSPSGVINKPSSFASATATSIAMKHEQSIAPSKSVDGMIVASGTMRPDGATTAATVIVGAMLLTEVSDPHHTHKTAVSYFSTFYTTLYPSHAMASVPTPGAEGNDDGVAEQILRLLGPCDAASPSDVSL